MKHGLFAFAAALCIVGSLGTEALAQQSALARIKASGAMTVAYSPDSLPFSFTGPDNTPAGYPIDLCKRVIAQIGNAIGQPDVKVNWISAQHPTACKWWRAGRPISNARIRRKRWRGSPTSISRH